MSELDRSPDILSPDVRSPDTRRTAIRVRHLSHRYGNFEVLRDVSFDVKEGEVFGFIGPNGAGKTTTIRVMATLLEPTQGRVEIDGLDVTMAPDEVRRLIGYMPDHAGVYDRVTVREYLEFFADAFRVGTTTVVDAVLELTDIGSLEDRLVATLSKGQKQRLQLARILLHDPKVLILDEPASDLDPRARIEIRNLLTELRGLGKTVLLSSHILTELADVCTSIGILEKGRVVVAGPIAEIGARLELQRAAAAIGHVAPAGTSSRPAPPPQVGSLRHRVKIRVMGDAEMAAQVVRVVPSVRAVDVSSGLLMVTFEGGERSIADIVSALVRAEQQVVAVEQERSDLERIFLEVTQGEHT